MPIVIGWELNNGLDSEDYRGGTVRDNNTYLTLYSYTQGPKNAIQFDSIEDAMVFGKKWIKSYTSHQHDPYVGGDRNKTILDYGKGVRLIIREYRPRS